MIQGVICGIRVEEMDTGLMQEIRYLDKLIDELAKGKTLEKILDFTEYLIQGFALNDSPLKQAGGGAYWYELLERIRDIRFSQKLSDSHFLVNCKSNIVIKFNNTKQFVESAGNISH
ncbi:hypothetical protein FACS1894104_4760 [Actinomycetota bacterium]|nr:hypothetical protein FACS1894104_4760 [Actinomycetota bacterium]